MALDPKKLKTTAGKARGVKYGGFVLCKLAGSRDYIVAIRASPFGNAAAAVKSLMRATGAESDEIDDSRCAVGILQKTSGGLVATLSKAESSGSWNKSSLEKRMVKAFDRAGVSAPDLTTVVGDSVVRGQNALDHDDFRYKKRVSGAKGVRVLDADERKHFDAQVKNGKVMASEVVNGWNLFVIGNDNRFYAAPYKRGGDNEGTFDHRTFFAGKPVRCAGLLRMRGSNIIAVSDASNYYNTSADQLAMALGKIVGGQKALLDGIEVMIGSKRYNGTAWMAAYAGKDSESAPEDAGTEVTIKASQGAIGKELAELILQGAGSGAWLLRFDNQAGRYAIASNNGGRVLHSLTKSDRGADAVLLDRSKRGLVLPGRAPLPLHKTMDAKEAESRLGAGGQWLLRTDDQGKRVVSLNNGMGIHHAAVGKIGAVKLVTSLKLDPGKAVLP